jgi:Uma2 family endonuclease
MSEFANVEEQFPEVAQWCEEHLGSKEGWVINKKERRVYFYNLEDATLFKLRWC